MAEFFKNIFYKSQRFLGVDLSYIFRGGFWLGLDQIASIVIGIGLSVALANLISQTTLGFYRYILSFFSVLTIATLPNLGVAVTSYVAKGFEGLLKKAVGVRIKWGFWGSLAGAVISVYYFVNGNHLLGISFVILAVFLPFVDSFNLYGAYLNGRKLFREQAGYNIFVRIVSAGVLIAALFVTDNLFWILLAYFLPYLVLRPVIFYFVIKKFPPNQQSDLAMLSYGKYLSTIQFMNVAVNYLDNLLIFNFLGAAPLAVYSIAHAPISKFQQMFSVIPTLALPKFSERPEQETKKMLMKKILKASVLATVVAGAYILAAPFIFDFLFPRYGDSILYTQLLAVTLPFMPLGLLYTFFQAHALKDQITRYNVAIRIAQLVLTVVLIPLLGILGAVIARIAFRAVSTLTLLALYKKIAPKPIS